MRKKFFKDNRGIGAVEMILLLVILIGIVLLFQGQIQTIVNSAFQQIGGDANKILGR